MQARKASASTMIFSLGLIAIVLFACPSTQVQNEPPASSPILPPTQEPLPVKPLPPSPPSSPPPNFSSNTSTNISSNTSEANTLESQWSLITKPNVQDACLSVAKKEAVSKGFSESLVFSCSCSAQESQESKSYACSVSALDGGHPAQISCTKSLQTCEITSEQGTYTYTFGQLQQMAGSS